jgi:hypothetical protein
LFSKRQLILTILFGAAMSAAAAGQQSDQSSLAARLRGGSFEERNNAAREILQISPSDRNESLWLALTDELQRLGTESHARGDALDAGRQVPSLGEIYSEYYFAVASGVSQWTDPRALPTLITSAGRGMVVVQAIVRFGETAVSPLTQTVRDGHRDEKGGALLALQILLEGHLEGPQGTYNIPPARLSSVVRNQIVQLTRDLLKSKTLEWPHIPSLAALALATGDEDLRQQIESLAISLVGLMALSGLNDVPHILQLQAAISNQLRKHQR